MIDRIEKRALSLGTFPERGTRLSIPNVDGLRFILERPYLVIYRASPTSVEIVAVLHGARDIAAELSGSPGGG